MKENSKDAFAYVTDRYCTCEGALQRLFDDCGFQVDDGGQLTLSLEID